MAKAFLQSPRMDEYSARTASFLEDNFVDSDGLVYCSINEKTLKPFRDKEISDAVCFNTIAAPKKLWKSAFFNYEDSEMATADYLRANIYRYLVTKEASAKKIARRTFNVLKSLALAGVKVSEGVVSKKLGFIPKPYGGLKTAHLSSEVSIDQHLKIMVAMLFYRDTLATASQKKWIEKFIGACCDCWCENNYTFNYFTNLCRWGVLAAHSIAFGLLCSALGEKFSKSKTHSHWFGVFDARLRQLEREGFDTDTSHLICDAARELLWLKPEQSQRWIRLARKACDALAPNIDENGHVRLFRKLLYDGNAKTIKPHWGSKEEYQGWQYWGFLRWRGNITMPASSSIGAELTLFELSRSKKHYNRAVKFLNAQTNDLGYQKWCQPQSKNDLPAGFKVLGQRISGYNTVSWFKAYWQARYIEQESMR